ncbi:NACHT nucleoside triphosphatase [Penicillium italicum]|uniref:NACHT nucleoside triphosphatase n=1 Tax=Penicillium italicum TaxID=40296 RepID=A0A0A2LGE8_PENIT|nr:NACHT nucleoside triphosphatase [Penicillium italicum]
MKEPSGQKGRRRSLLIEEFIIDRDEDLQKAAKAKLEAIQNSRLKIKIGNDRVLNVRDGVTKVVRTVLSYNAVITAAVAAEPSASLAWGGVAALLPVVSTALSQTNEAIDNLDGIALLLVRFRAIEVIYDLSEHPEKMFTASDRIKELHAQLRTQTINLYAQILEYQADLIEHYSHKQMYRMIKSVGLSSGDKFSDIQTTAASASTTLQTLDSGAIAGVDRQLSSLAESVKEIMDKLVEVNANILDIPKVQRIVGLPRATYAAFDEGPDGFIPPPCHRDTRKEVLGTIRRWAEGESENNECLFWLSGMAGTGKSTIARTVAREFHKQGQLGASFFFSWAQKDRASTEMFFSSLARGLALTVSGFDKCLYESIQNYGEVHQRSLKKQWDHLIFQPLKALEASLLVPLRLVFVIDALDECKGTRAVPDIIRLLLEAKDLERIQLKIFVTSRNEKHIVESLQEKSDVAHLSLEDGSGTSTRDDISVYVKYMLGEIAKSKGLKDWPTEKQTEGLLQLSGQLFIAAATACRFLQSSKFPDRRLTSFLEAKRTPGSGTDPIDDMYRHLLEMAIIGPDHDDFIKLFPKVVGLILVSKEPISISDMETLLGQEEELISFILDSLRSVLIVPQDRNDPIRLFHLSFRDFLIDKTRCQDERFFIDESKAHRRSFENCLKLLSSQLKKDLCELQHPGTLLVEVDRERVIQHIPRVLQYGCQHWTFHLENARISPSDNDEIKEALGFVHEHLLHWIEALALLGRINDAIIGIVNLRNLALDVKNQEFEDFAKDAYRFLLCHRPTIEEAPLQIYYLATVFSPTESLVRNRFSEHFPTWLRKPPPMESYWGLEDQTFATDAHVYASAISFDGRLIAYLSLSGITVWNAITGNLEHTFIDPLGLAQQYFAIFLVFSQDGNDLTAMWKLKRSDDYQMFGWSLITGKPMSSFTERQFNLLSMTELSDWSFPSGGKSWQTRDSDSPMTLGKGQFEVVLSADGTTMSLFNYRRAYPYIGNAHTKQISHILEFDFGITMIRLSATRAAILLEGHHIKVWDLVQNHEIDIQCSGDIFGCLALSSGGLNFAYADGTCVKVLDIDSKKVDHIIELDSYIYSLDFLHGGKLTATYGADRLPLWDLQRPAVGGTPEIWDLVDETRVPEQQSWLHAIMPSGDGTSVAIFPKGSGKEGQGHLGLWAVDDPNEGKEDLRTTDFQTSVDESLALTISPNGMKIAIVKWSNVLELWRFSKEGNEWDLHCTSALAYDAKSHPPHLNFSSDGMRVLSYSDNRYHDDWHLAVWCVDNKDCEFEYQPSTPLLLAVLSHQHGILAMGLCWGEVKIQDLPSKTVRTIMNNGALPECMEFSPQDTRIAIGWDNGQVWIHNIATAETEWILEGHAMLVNALQFCPNDSWREGPFYTVNSKGNWIVHDNKAVMALPPNFSAPHQNSYQEHRANTIAFFSNFTYTDRLVYFMFEGVPRF